MKINKIRWKNRFAGWIAAVLLLVPICLFSGVTVYADETYQITEKQMQGQITTDSSLNVRSGPGTSYGVITKVDGGAAVTITGQADNGWYRIEIDGQTGFVSDDYVSATEAAAGESPEELEELEPEPGEPESGYGGLRQSPFVMKTIGIGAAIVVILVMLLLTVRGLKKDRADDDDEYDADDEYAQDEYSEEEEEADSFEDAYDDDDGGDVFDDDGAYADDCDDEAYAGDADEADTGRDEADAAAYDTGCYDARAGRRASRKKRTSGKGKREYVLREEDYRVEIDPSFFEDREPIEQPAMVTGYLESKMIEEAARAQEVEAQNARLHEPGGNDGDKQKELDQAMAKLSELQKEIERLKSQK